MIQRDYILRLIAEAARFVALALGVRQRGDDGRFYLDRASRALTGQPLDVLEALGDDALLGLCAPRGAFVPDLAVALADVLLAAGDAARARLLYAAARDGGAVLPLHAHALLRDRTLPPDSAA